MNSSHFTHLLALLQLSLAPLLPAIAQDTTKPFFDQFKSCVVLIEKIEGTLPDGAPKLAPLGTGFWVSTTTEDRFFVSNKHVFAGRDQIAIRMTQVTGQRSALMIIDLKNQRGQPRWVGHPDSLTDIAAIQVDSIFILNNVQPKIIRIQRSLFATESQLIEGDDVFFIGFPLGVRTTDNSFPLLRSGVISLKPTDDFLVTAGCDTLGKHIYLLDAYSTGGSSGSPVFLKPGVNRPFLTPNVFDITETKFIGIVSGHVLDYQEVFTLSGKGVAASNASLTIVHPAERVLETILLLKKK
ncbi:MAG: serine protease [Ignavibacteria bacterium]|nr:serine protease [Ignavibacteria bacterium]